MSNEPHAATAEENRARFTRIEAITAGALPEVRDWAHGMPFSRRSAERDCQIWVDDEIAYDPDRVPLDPIVQRDLERLCRRFTLQNAQKACRSAENREGATAIAGRLYWYRAALGDTQVYSRLAAICLSFAIMPGLSGPFALAAAIGYSQRCSTPDDAFKRGEQLLAQLISRREKFVAVGKTEAAAVPDDDVDETDDEWIQRVLEDRAEFPAQGETMSLLERQRILRERAMSSMIVVPVLPDAGKTHKGEIFKSWNGIAGRPLPLVKRPDLVEARRQLVARGEHTADVVDIMLRDLAPSEFVRFRPTIFVGSPGAGKSALALAIAEACDVPSKLISLAGASDSAVGGTSAQWHSAREAPPLQLIREKRVANPLIIFDEVDKAGTSRHNGSALDAIGIVLERDQARRFHDPALEVDCDLSMVSFVLTANDITLVPDHIRDRCRIVRVPAPEWKHIAPLVERIIGDIAKERELNRRWFDPLAQDEMGLIQQSWQSGSLRQLRRIVETIVDGRDLIMGRC
jgi:hypothetical protein